MATHLRIKKKASHKFMLYQNSTNFWKFLKPRHENLEKSGFAHVYPRETCALQNKSSTRSPKKFFLKIIFLVTKGTHAQGLITSKNLTLPFDHIMEGIVSTNINIHPIQRVFTLTLIFAKEFTSKLGYVI